MKLFTRIAHLFLLSCRKASFLIVKKRETRLNKVEEVQLGWHKKACQYCAAFDVQLEKIDEAIRDSILEQLHETKLDEEEKQKLITNIQEGLK